MAGLLWGSYSRFYLVTHFLSEALPSDAATADDRDFTLWDVWHLADQATRVGTRPAVYGRECKVANGGFVEFQFAEDNIGGPAALEKVDRRQRVDCVSCDFR